MPSTSISIEGIDQAITNLNYRRNSIKQKTLFAIRAFYSSEESVRQLDSIDADVLITSIWDLDDNIEKIKTKRRNFSSIRSSINRDLEKLSKKKLNPENIIITESNVFDMSQEAKNEILNSFSDAVQTSDIDIDKATSLLKTIADFLKDYEPEDTDSGDLIDQIKNILDKISKGSPGDGDQGPGETIEEIDEPDKEDLEEIELDEDEELEEVDEIEDDDQDIEELEEVVDDVEEILDDIDEDETEEIELDEDQELEEIELDEDKEELDEIEIDEDEELEEIDEPDKEDLEEIELDEDEELEEIDELDEEELKALEEFREKKELAEHFDNTLGEREKKYNQYVTIPQGRYTIGTKKSIKSSLELQEFDMPQVHISMYPVTNALFEIFIEESGYITTAEKQGHGRVYTSRFKKNAKHSIWHKNAGSEDIKGACWYMPSGPGSNLHEKKNHPVVQVSVEDAIAFASWIGRRIPTEAEWEAAARTDMGYKYPWGNEFNPKALNIEQSGLADTSAVDKYDAFANQFKIVDMLGNVLEWTSDMETPCLKTKKNIKYCVAKGGAWNGRDDVTISSRALFRPGFTSNTIGFRCISEIFL